MKSKVIIVFLFFVSSYIFSQTHIELTLDFSAEQDGVPYPNYAAAYLINTSTETLTFTSGWNGLWFGQVNCFSNMSSNLRGLRETLMEVTFDTNVNEGASADVYILRPGEKIRIFSAAFSSENRTLYPYSELTGTVFVDRQERTIKAFLNQALF